MMDSLASYGEYNSKEYHVALEVSEKLCLHSASVILGLMITMFILSLTVCWFPCFRCAFHWKDAIEENRSNLLSNEEFNYEGDDDFGKADSEFSIGSDL